jgi:hypothetical protein
MLGAMKRLVLVRRREIWIPTVWGWLFILLVGAGASMLAGRHAHSFLAPNQPSGARFLVVEGWIPPRELDQAVEAFRNGGYEHIITTGGTVEDGLHRSNPASYASLARDYLVRRGVPNISATAVPAPASDHDRTFLSAVMVRAWLGQSGHAVDALDVFSSGVHSRRSWVLYRMAFGSRVSVGIIAARPSTYDPDAWWRTSVGAKVVISEALNWIWTEIFFQPGALRSQ